MRVRDLFSLSTRMFRTRPARTWLTILGISVGISAVLFLVALGYGLQNIILEKIVFDDALLSLTVTPANELIDFNDAAVDRFRQLNGVADVAPEAAFSGEVILGDLYGTAEIRAVGDGFFNYAGVSPVIGKLFEKNELNQVVVSRAVLRLFGIADDQEIIGKPIKLDLSLKNASSSVINLPDPFVVKGVLEDSENSYVYAPLDEIRKYSVSLQYDQARIKLVSNNDIETAKEQVLGLGYQVASLSETIDQANKIFRIIQIVLGLFGAVALVVSSIGMFNTMTVTLLERTNEIGIMRAIGATKGTLKSIFLFESLLIGFLGGVVGVVLGIGLAELVNFGVNSLAVRFGGAPTNLFYFPTQFLGGIIILSVVIGFLSGVFPARRAANLEPLEALRYK